MKETAKNVASDNNLMRFCNDIISAHRTRAFRGKSALWGFLNDVAANLNKDDHGNHYNENT